jgi:hypothetical protein
LDDSTLAGSKFWGHIETIEAAHVKQIIVTPSLCKDIARSSITAITFFGPNFDVSLEGAATFMLGFMERQVSGYPMWDQPKVTVNWTHGRPWNHMSYSKESL